MGLFEIVLIAATFLCTLVAGFLFAFAVVVMPGIKRMEDGEFIHAFQVMDGVIQDNQPVFLLVWVGSVLALVAAAVLGIGQMDQVGRVLIIVATVAYVLGVQVPTMTKNVPLNNRLQTLDVGAMDEKARQTARQDFEPRWNRWNVFRTTIASLVSGLLLILLYRI